MGFVNGSGVQTSKAQSQCISAMKLIAKNANLGQPISRNPGGIATGSHIFSGIFRVGNGSSSRTVDTCPKTVKISDKAIESGMD